MVNPAPLSAPSTYLIRMAVFLAGSILALGVLSAPSNRLLEFFSANPLLNGLIVAVFVIGVIYAFRYVLILLPRNLVSN